MKTIHALLIEDNPGDARLVQEMLTQLDDIRFDITMLETLAKGAAWLDEHEPDVVLLDLGLPDSQGIGTFKAVQEQAPLIPIVVLTGLQDEDMAMEMAGKGAQEYLVKEDINSDVLHHAVQYAIQRKNIERRMARLNSLLQAVRDINQLIVRETDPKALVTNACAYLARVSGYHHVRIFLTDETGETHIGVCAGPDGTEPCPERDLPLCMSQAIADGEMFSPESKDDICSKCTWSDAYNEGNKAISVPLSYLGNMYGALSVFIPAERQPIGGEEGLFQEVADDLAFALYDQELEEKHRAAEERYRQLVESTPGLICQLDPDGTTRFVNSYVEELTGYPVEEVIGQNWWELFYPGDTREQVDELYEHFNAGEDVRGHEMELVDKRGERHIISWNSFNQWEDGALDKIFGVGMDITDLQQSEEKYRLLAENAIDVVWRMDLDMRFTYLSSSLEDLVGYEPEEWIGTKPTDHAPLEQAEKMQRVVAEYLEQWPNKDHAIFKSKIVDSEGNEIPVEITGRVVLDDDGRPVGLQGATRDITERREAQQRTEHLYSLLKAIRNVNQVIVKGEGLTEIMQQACESLVDTRSYLEVTVALLDDNGEIAPVATAGRHAFTQSWSIAPDGTGEAPRCVRKVLDGGDIEIIDTDSCVDCEFKQEMDAHTTITLPMRHGGLITGILHISLEEGVALGTEEKDLLIEVADDLAFARDKIKKDEELIKSEEKFKRVFEASNVGKSITLPNGQVNVNKAFADMLGYSRDELEKKKWQEITVPEDIEFSQKKIEPLLKGDEDAVRFEKRYVHKDGSTVWTDISTAIQRDPEGKPQYFVTNIVDITDRKQAQQQLEERELKLRLLFEETSNPILVANKDGQHIDGNQAALDFLECDMETLREKPIWEWAPLSRRERQMEEHTPFEEPRTLETDYLVNGKIKTLLLNVVPLTIDGEKLIYGIGQDITERKKAQEKLEKSERKFRNLFESMAEGVVYQDADGNIISANPAAERILGLSLEQMQRKTSMDPRWKAIDENGNELPGEQHPAMVALRTGEKVENFVQGIFVPERNEYVWMLVNSIPQFKEGSDKPYQVYSTFRDITQRKQAEDSLRESERLLKEAQRVAHIGHWKLDPDIGTPVWSEEIFRIFGLDPEEGEPSFADHKKYLHSEDWPRLNDAVTTASETGEPFDIEFRIMRPDGELRWMHAIGTATMDDDGTITEVFGTAQDITERKRYEEQLRETKNRYQSLFENSLVGIGLATPEGNIIEANDAFTEILGYDKAELKEINAAELYCNRAEREEIQKTMRGDGRLVDYETTLQHRDRTEINVLLSISEIDIEGTPFYQTTCLDITERKQAQQQLEEREKKFREIFHNANDAMYLHQLTEDGMPGTFVEVNDVACDMLGYTHEEFMEMSPLDIDDPEMAADVPGIMEELLDEGQATFEMRHVAKDGYKVPVEISSHTFTLNGQRFVLSIARDITERKQREKIERKLRQRIEAGLQAGNLAWWEMELPSGDVVFDDRKAEMLGYAPERFETYEDFTELLHPEDYERAIQAMRDHLQGRTENYEVEYRIKTSDGRYRWFRDVGGVTEKDEGADHARVVGIVEDITERKQAQQELAESEEKYRAIVEGSHDAIFIYRGDEFLFVNDRATEITGYSEENLLDMFIWDLLHPDDRDRVQEIGRWRARGEDAPNVYQARVVTKDGNVRYCEFSMTAISYQGMEAAMGAVRDITRQKLAEREREQYINELQFTADAIMSVSRMQDTDEICQRIAEKVHEVNEDAVVAVSLYDPAQKAISVRAIEGLGKRTKKLLNLFGGDPAGLTFDPEDMGEVADLFTSGKLERVPGGLYDLTGGKLPRAACRAAEKLYDIDAAYTVGFALGDTPRGGISIFTPPEHEINHWSAIETIASHVSTALQRRQAEDERKKALVEMERALDLEKRFKADAAHFFLNPIAIAKGYMEIATEEMPEEPEGKIRRAQKAIRRVEAVIKNIVEKGEIHE